MPRRNRNAQEPGERRHKLISITLITELRQVWATRRGPAFAGNPFAPQPEPTTTESYR